MPRGLSLAREAGRLLLWTDSDWLFWINRDGARQAQTHFPATISCAAVSEDGTAFVAAEIDGRVSWLAADLQARWDRKLAGKPTAIAVDPLGLVAAIATNQGQLVCLHSDGRQAREVTCPRPARHLAFIPGTATLIAAADLGWLAAFDLEAGDWLWRDAPVCTIGGLAVAGEGEPILIACYSDGLRGYARDGKPWRFAAPAAPCRSVAISYDGQTIVTVQIDGLVMCQGNGLAPGHSYRPDAAPVALTMSALGDTLYLAQADRKVIAVNRRLLSGT
jgi:hypothetical protein